MMVYEKLEGLKMEDIRYQGDKSAFELLKKVPLLDVLGDIYLKFICQTQMYPSIQGDCFRVTPDTCPELYDIYKTALTRLDMPREYPLFIQSSYDYNAFSTGSSGPIVVINSSFAKRLAEREMLALLGHELGHIKSGNLLYHNIAFHLSAILQCLPAGQFLSMGAYYAIMNWARMEEFTADRAGAIASGSVEGMIKIGKRLLDVDAHKLDLNFDLDNLLAQNDDFNMEQNDILGKLIFIFNTAGMNHPWAVSRIKALYDWEQSGGFDGLLAKYGIAAN